MNERILISGAGIAGLTLAHWLARHGFRPTVVERAARLRAGGNGVDVRDLAGDVVERMGIMPQVRAAAADVVGMKFVDADDRAVARIDIRDAGSVEIMRGDLVTLLHQVTDVERRPRRVEPVVAADRWVAGQSGGQSGCRRVQDAAPLQFVEQAGADPAERVRHRLRRRVVST